MEAATSKLREWREDPRVFVRECLGAAPDPWQDKVLEAFPREKRIALKACKGPGKSTVVAWCCWNFLLTRPHPKVVATSITGDNLRDGLWAEMSKWQQRSPLLKSAFQWSAERIVSNDHPETWWGSARQWSRSADATQQADTLAGIHAEFVLFVLEEAGGIPDGVASAAEAALSTGTETKLLIDGNPTHLSGPLYRACTRDRAMWWVYEITGDPDDPMRSPRIDIEWARSQIARYGRDNPWVMVNVLGKFPPGQSNAVLGVEEVNEASRRVLPGVAYEDEPKVLGVDVARFGTDRTVLCLRQGRNIHFFDEYRNLDVMQTSGRVANAINQQEPAAVFIDDGGVGGGVVDRLKELHFDAIPVNFGGKALQKQYLNRRAEMWMGMAGWLKAGGCIPPDSELISELTAPTYDFKSDGRYVIESKEEMKKRGLPSPDKADALALTFAEPVAHQPFVRRQNLGEALLAGTNLGRRRRYGQ